MKTINILIFLLWGIAGYAQQVGSSALTVGGNTAPLPSGGTLSQSVGELATITLGGDPVFLTQGVLQVYPDMGTGISVTTPLAVNLYPNPASAEIHIETEEISVSHIRIWDVAGKEIYMAPLQGAIINVRHLAEGNYFLGLYEPGGELRYVWQFQKI